LVNAVAELATAKAPSRSQIFGLSINAPFLPKSPHRNHLMLDSFDRAFSFRISQK
jgi:hypothetical protein